MALRRRPYDVVLVAWMAWIFDAVNNLGTIRQPLAERHGAAILDVERSLHLAPELALNRWLAGQHALTELVVFWYVNVHGAVTFAVFGWLWWRRPDLLAPLRGAVFAVTAAAGAVFWLWPVAPPRMLVHPAYLDLVAYAHHLPGWNVTTGAADANQLAALPSIHIAWAVWSAVAVWRLTNRRWVRGLAVAYPFVTLFAVMATANHYLADGVTGAALTAVAIVVADRVCARRGLRRAAASAGRPGVAPEPVAEAAGSG